ncbi:MAG: hypothetical protein KGZ70_05485 [Hydrogenophaga sp.]|uniref:hypothetical protein n=1 Tax=Hydrogenophaga sp. TaxID=1904254 RepID=UPI001BC44755|nr:hypothetical protein [Hydrogenophaga sp.]MBS3911275.1 hypothetical protein [Hydrogenophaga sp.]MDO9146176.1 hypothetical protein [Hydrogenophaga sp.]MDO9605067.1 hypothetical protein [Hydrogenophaga sp.]MDP2162705.1 hypothetical protein [Hydrogenophaga sp.]MDP3477017.1 hypothetical protein [Hydrogenophaga sp.]
MTHKSDRHPLPPDGPALREHPLPPHGMTSLERSVNLVVAAVLVAFGLYACAVPF